jgi:para-nitrobenzyl esterase
MWKTSTNGRHRLRFALLAAGALLAGNAAFAAPVVTTKYGELQGTMAGGASVFLGVPFAQPPVGELRWRAPQPPSAWQGVREATRFGGICPQVEIYAGFNTPSTTEDCLYLNVFVPGKVQAGAKLPVMFWIYGGGFAGGESNDYDGRKLALQGNVIVVTINYRVGALGNLAHPALAREDRLHTNYGILDQQAALAWVRDNIAAFGGDPGHVTIFGESAGAACSLARSRRAARSPAS